MSNIIEKNEGTIIEPTIPVPAGTLTVITIMEGAPASYLNGINFENGGQIINGTTGTTTNIAAGISLAGPTILFFDAYHQIHSYPIDIAGLITDADIIGTE